MVCEVWQSSQVGSSRSVSVFSGQWTLVLNTSSMPWWQVPQVEAMLSGWTVDRGLSGGSSPCALWQFAHVAVTTRPLFSRPLPWMLSM